MSEPSAPNGQGARGLKHGLGFLGSGIFAFLVDAGVLKLLTSLAGLGALPARLVSISIAIVAGWLAHRRFTFAVTAPPSVNEFVKYVGVAWSAAAVNYAIFATVLFVRPLTDNMVAIFISGIGAMGVSYVGMRFGAFRQR